MKKNQNFSKPFLRWAGSKRQLLSDISQFWPGGPTRYIEPFVGSACLFFHIQPTSAILGDINPDLIQTYRAVRNNPGLVIESLKRLPVGKDEYYRIRSINPLPLAEPEQAARFIYLNRHCFNGLYRTNRAGAFNVPFGDTKGRIFYDDSIILTASEHLKRVHLMTGDFAETIATAGRNDFVYLDPPYSVSRKKTFTEYHPTVFDSEDIMRLRTILFELDSKGTKFVLSYAESPEALSLAKGWHITKVKTRRNIAGFAGSRGLVYEILATNIH